MTTRSATQGTPLFFRDARQLEPGLVLQGRATAVAVQLSRRDASGSTPSVSSFTVFAGSPRWSLPRDDEVRGHTGQVFFSQAGVKQHRFASSGTDGAGSNVSASADARIALYDESNCWWEPVRSRPSAMPTASRAEPIRRSSTAFDEVRARPHRFGRECHPHCDCGRYIEIGNSVFMQYRRRPSGFGRTCRSAT